MSKLRLKAPRLLSQQVLNVRFPKTGIASKPAETVPVPALLPPWRRQQ